MAIKSARYFGVTEAAMVAVAMRERGANCVEISLRCNRHPSTIRRWLNHYDNAEWQGRWFLGPKAYRRLRYQLHRSGPLTSAEGRFYIEPAPNISERELLEMVSEAGRLTVDDLTAGYGVGEVTLIQIRRAMKYYGLGELAGSAP